MKSGTSKNVRQPVLPYCPRVELGVWLHFRPAGLKGLSQDNLRGRYLQGPLSATIGWHTNTHAIQVYFFKFIC